MGGTHIHTHTCTCTCLHTHNTTPHALSLTHIFSLTSTHLTCRRKSPVAYSFWLWFIFCALMPSPAVCLCVPGESRHSCCSDLITSGSNWWFCPHAPDPTGVLAQARLPWTLSTPPRHPLNTNSTSENPNTLCVLLKKCASRTIFHDLLKWKFLSLCMRDRHAEVKKWWTQTATFHVDPFDLHHPSSSYLEIGWELALKI